MPIQIRMPALSPTMEKGNLAKWVKKEGDKVKAGDVIAEIETDKATMEYESIDDGVLAKIVVPEGSQDVPVNALIAVLAEEGEDPKAAAAGKGPSTAKTAPPPAASPQPAAKATDRDPAAQKARGAAPPLSFGVHAPEQQRARSGEQRVFASPLARRIAKGAGIDIGLMAGSGPHGRIVARDVEAAKAGKGVSAP